MTQKYRVLRVMAVVYKVLAWVALVLGIIISIFALVASSLISQQLGTPTPAGGGFVAFVVFLVYTLVTFGSLYALAEGIYLLFDIEQQTRQTKDTVVEMRPAA